jgi:hypothetical protein
MVHLTGKAERFAIRNYRRFLFYRLRTQAVIKMNNTDSVAEIIGKTMSQVEQHHRIHPAGNRNT